MSVNPNPIRKRSFAPTAVMISKKYSPIFKTIISVLLLSSSA
jgi:hypothetical protein